MANKPEIQADALLNLVLDEQSLQRQLKAALGTTIREAASSAALGDSLVSPASLKKTRRDLEKFFADASKDLREALNLASSDSLRDTLKGNEKAGTNGLRTDTIRKFQRDLKDLLTGEGRARTASMPALPSLKGELLDELKAALRVFGQDALRTGSYKEREKEIAQASRNVDKLGGIFTELAGLPAVAARDLQAIRRIVNDKDTGRYLKLQATEREQLAKSSQALSLQTQTLERLASTLSKMGFGDAASEIKAANQARRDLVKEFSRVTSPKAVEARARQEQVAADRTRQQERRRDRAALRREMQRREEEREAGGTYTPAGFQNATRTPGSPGAGLLAAMGTRDRVASGYKPRDEVRGKALESLRARSAADQKAERERLDKWFSDAAKSDSAAAKNEQDRLDRLAAESKLRQKHETAIWRAGQQEDAAERSRLDKWFKSADDRDAKASKDEQSRVDQLAAESKLRQKRDAEEWRAAQAQRKGEQDRLDAWFKSAEGRDAQAAKDEQKRLDQMAAESKLRQKHETASWRSGQQEDAAERERLEAWFKAAEGRDAQAAKDEQKRLDQMAAESKLRQKHEASRWRADQQVGQGEQDRLEAWFKAAEERDRQAARAELVRVDQLAGESKVRQREQARRDSQAGSLARSQASQAEARRIVDARGGIDRLTDKQDIADVSAGLRAARTSALKAVEEAKALHGEESRQYREAMAGLDQVKADRQALADRQLTLRNEDRDEGSARRSAAYADARRIISERGGIGGIDSRVDLNDVSRGLNAQFKRISEQLNILRTAGNIESDEYRRLLSEFNDLSRQRRDVDDRRRELTDLDRPNPPDGTERLLSQFGRYAVGYGGLYAAMAGAGQLASEIVELDRAFYSIKAVTQATDVEMQSIARSIREVALSTNFSTREIAAGAEILGQAGVAPADIGKVLDSTAKFASATNSPLEVAADLVTTVREVFTELEDSPNVIADQLTRAINISKMGAEDLKTILSLTGQTAGSYNISLEQMLAGATTLRNAGVKPPTIATGMRQAMLEMFNPDTATMKALGKRYQEMGETEMNSAAIQQRFFGFTNAQNPLIAVLSELRRLGFTDEGQKTLQRGFDIRAFNAIQGLIDNFKELEAAESRITFGQAAAEGAEVQLQSLTATLENLGSSIVVLAEQMSGGLVRTLADGAQSATDMVEKLVELDQQMKLTGQDGIANPIASALAGGAAGFASGRGLVGRVAGAAAGATAGAWLGGGAELDQDNEFGAGDAAGLAATVLVVGKFLLWAKNAIKAVSPIADAADRVGDVAEGAAGTGKLAGLAGRIGARAIPVLGWALTAITILESVVDLLPEDEAQKLAERAEAARGIAAKAAADLQKRQDLAATYDVNAESAKEGTTAAAFGKYREQLTNYQLTLDEVFGNLTDGKAREAEEALRQYAQTPGSQRQNLLPGLSALAGRQFTATDDKQLFDLGSQAEALKAAVDGMVQSTREDITRTIERIRQARASGGTVSERDQAFSNAFSEHLDSLRGIMDGTATLSPVETEKNLRAFYATFHEALIVKPGEESDAQAKNMVSLTEQLAAALAAADNSAEIAAAVTQIGGAVEFMNLSVMQRLQATRNAITQSMAAIDAELAQKEEQLAALDSPVANFPRVLGQLMGLPTGLIDGFAGGDRQSQVGDLKAQIEQLKSRRKAEDEALIGTNQRMGVEKTRVAEQNAKVTAEAPAKAQALIGNFLSNPDIQRALTSGNAQVLKDIGLTATQREMLKANLPALTGGDTSALTSQLSTPTLKGGEVQLPKELGQLQEVFDTMASGIQKVSEAEKRRERDSANLITVDELRARERADTAINKADHTDNYALLTSDSPNNPLRQKYAAERVIAEKELAQARAALEDSKKDEKSDEASKAQALVKAEARLANLDLAFEQEMDKYKDKARAAGERAQRAAEAEQRKAEQEAKKQAKIAVTQTAIEQRIVKQDFEEAIRTGDSEAFLAKSKEYEAVQAKLIENLRDELEAKDYTLEQIEAEIKLRDDLNKPLAEQVENIRKLAAQQKQMRDLEFRDIGSGPDLGGKEATAYLGARGFTRDELAGAGQRDLARLAERRSQVEASLGNALFRRDQETVQDLSAELEELDTQLGETRRGLEDLTMSADASIYEAFSPRNLLIELENSEFTFQNMGKNLRSGVVSALDEAGDAMARLVTEGGDFMDVMGQILRDFAQQELGMMFKTNLREGLSGIVEGYTGADGGQGGAGGIWGAMTRGFDNLFSLDGGKDGTAGANAVNGTLYNLANGVPGAGAATATGTMTVTAGSVTVIGGGGGTPPLSDVPGIPKTSDGTPGVSAEGEGLLSGMWDKVSSTLDSFTTGIGDVFSGLGDQISGLFSGLGGLFGGSGGGGGGFLSSLFGGGSGGGAAASGGFLASVGSFFGMAGGGTIDKKGLVRGSGRKGVDSVPVRVKGTDQLGLLAPGEGVLNARAVDALGADWVDAANSGRLFRKAVGGVMGASYNASQRAQASAANSVARSAQAGPGDVQVSLKNVNVLDKSEMFAAMQTRQGEDLMINVLKKRGAIN